MSRIVDSSQRQDATVIWIRPVGRVCHFVASQGLAIVLLPTISVLKAEKMMSQASTLASEAVWAKRFKKTKDDSLPVDLGVIEDLEFGGRRVVAKMNGIAAMIRKTASTLGNFEVQSQGGWRLQLPIVLDSPCKQ